MQRAAEAIEYLDLALKMHQEEFGHGTWRRRTLLMLKFSALVELRRFDDSEQAALLILKIAIDAENWRRYVEDARWMAGGYAAAGDTPKAEDLLHLFKREGLEPGREGKVASVDDEHVTVDFGDGQTGTLTRSVAETVSVLADPSPPPRTALPEQLVLGKERYGR